MDRLHLKYWMQPLVTSETPTLNALISRAISSSFSVVATLRVKAPTTPWISSDISLETSPLRWSPASHLYCQAGQVDRSRRASARMSSQTPFAISNTVARGALLPPSTASSFDAHNCHGSSPYATCDIAVGSDPCTSMGMCEFFFRYPLSPNLHMACR